MKGKCLGKVKPLEREDAYYTKTPQAIARICTERCPYDVPKCGAKGCDFFKSEKERLISKNVVKGRKKRPC